MGTRALGAAVVVLALAALAGTQVASATQICKPVKTGGDGKCPNGSLEKELAKGESFTVTSTDVVLTSASTSVTCSRSSVGLKMTSENAISLIRGRVTALSFANCKTAGGTECTTAVSNLPYKVGYHNEDIIVYDEAGIVIEVHCGFLISCELTAQEQLLSNKENLLLASAEEPGTEGAFCPIAPRFDASYSPRSEFTFRRGR
jgi:hypothetical protein